jgi:hypothetical protein
MTTFKSAVSILLVTFTFGVLLSNPAYAYLDPGTGSALLQGVLGATAAIGIAVKLYWYRILRFLGLRKNVSTTEKPTITPSTKKDTD